MCACQAWECASTESLAASQACCSLAHELTSSASVVQCLSSSAHASQAAAGSGVQNSCLPQGPAAPQLLERTCVLATSCSAVSTPAELLQSLLCPAPANPACQRRTHATQNCSSNWPSQRGLNTKVLPRCCSARPATVRSSPAQCLSSSAHACWAEPGLPRIARPASHSQARRAPMPAEEHQLQCDLPQNQHADELRPT